MLLFFLQHAICVAKLNVIDSLSYSNLENISFSKNQTEGRHNTNEHLLLMTN